MTARLEWRGQEELWLVVENDSDTDAQLQALKIIVRWQQAEKAGAWKPYPMLLGPRMTFRLNVAHLARTVVDAELPGVPAEKTLDLAAELYTGAAETVRSESFEVKYDGVKASFTRALEEAPRLRGTAGWAGHENLPYLSVQQPRPPFRLSDLKGAPKVSAWRILPRPDRRNRQSGSHRFRLRQINPSARPTPSDSSTRVERRSRRPGEEGAFQYAAPSCQVLRISALASQFSTP